MGERMATLCCPSVMFLILVILCLLPLTALWTVYLNHSLMELGLDWVQRLVVGTSNSKIRARRPVGVEELLTPRWVLKGNGREVVNGHEEIVYTHNNLPL